MSTTPNETRSAGVLRDKYERRIVKLSSPNQAPSTTDVNVGGALYDSDGREILAVADAALPSLQLAPVKTRLTPKEGIGAPPNVAAPGNVREVFTATGAGVARSLWFACDMGAAAWDARLQAWYDTGGVAVGDPDFDIDLGTLFLYHNGAGNKDGMGLNGTPLSPKGPDNTTAVVAGRPPPGSQSVSLPRWHAEAMGPNFRSGQFRFPIPHSDGIYMRLMNPGSGVGNSGLFFQVHHQPGVTLPYRLKSLGRSWTSGLARPGYTPACPGSQVFVPHDQDASLLDINVSKTAWLAWFGMCCQAGTAGTPNPGLGYYWLERNYQITVDNDPSYVSSGTEDFFGGSYYWMTQNFGSNGVAAIGAANYTDAIANAGIDFLEWHDGIRFESRLKLDLLQEQARTGLSEHNMSYVGLYYQAV